MIDLRFGDALELMKQIPDNSIDCVVTDPPYEITSHCGGRSGLADRSSKTAVGNLNSPKNKTPAQMQDDEPADYYGGDEYSEGL